MRLARLTAMLAFCFAFPVALAFSAEIPGELRGVAVGTTLADLVERFDARETTAVPSSLTELAVVLAAMDAEQAKKGGWRRYSVQVGTAPRVEVTVDETTRRVYAVSFETSPEAFADALLHYSALLGQPRIVYDPSLSSSLVAMWGRQPRMLTLELTATQVPLGDMAKRFHLLPEQMRSELRTAFYLTDSRFQTRPTEGSRP